MNRLLILGKQWLIGVLGLMLTGTLFSQQGPQGATITLLGQANMPSRATTDVWGYFDEQTGREYALVGFGLSSAPPNAGFVIFDVSDPGFISREVIVNSVPGFDLKVWKQYVYTVSGGTFGGGGIVDISNPLQPEVVGSFPNSHNIFIDQQGFLYAACPSLKIYNLNPDPLNPQLVWSDIRSSCHDAAVIGTRLFDFHGSAGTFIYDVTTPSSPEFLGAITDPRIIFHHSGWTSPDGNYLFIADELASHPTADITVWDIRDLSNPQRIGSFGDLTSKVHNLYVIGDYAFTSYYTAGFRVFDVSNPRNIDIVDEYDTSQFAGESFVGAFGVYPFAPSGNIYVSDSDGGLFVFSFNGNLTSVQPGGLEVPNRFALLDNYPNPFNPETVIVYEIAEQAEVVIRIFDQLGRSIRTLVNARQGAGSYEARWDARDEAGHQVPSGTYFYRIQAGTFEETRRMVLLR